jgi:hypothetical protein
MSASKSLSLFLSEELLKGPLEERNLRSLRSEMSHWQAFGK